MAAEQLDLDHLEPWIAAPPSWATSGLPAEWWQFHCAHPEVARELRALAHALIEQGHRHLGIAMLWETLRYRTMLGASTDGPAPRLNNDHRAYFARWLMETDVELLGVFEIRSSQAEPR